MRTSEVGQYFESLTKKLSDYHVLFIRETDTPKIEIEVYNTHGIDPADIEKIKADVRDSIKKLEENR